MKQTHILIGEDDSGIIEVMTILLTEEGYTPHAASSKKEIDLICQSHQIEIIFLDIQLRGESGIEIAQSLKKNETTSIIPIIMLSANPDIAAITKIAGADDYLAKPFEIEDIVKKIKKNIR